LGPREKIIVACRELARTRGFYAVTVDDLAAAAGVSKKTVYRYFRSKEAIIEATLEDFMNKVAAEVDRIVQSEQETARIVSLVFKYLSSQGQFIVASQSLNDLRRYYPLLWQRIDGFRTEQARALIGVLLKRSEKESIKNLDPRIITEVILASIQVVLTPAFILENNLTFEEAAEQLSRLFFSLLD